LPFEKYLLTNSAVFLQTTILIKSDCLSPPSLGAKGLFIAIVNLHTAILLVVCYSSGSATKRPIKIALFIMLLKLLKIYFSKIMYKIHIANNPTAGIINNNSVLFFFFIKSPFNFKATSKLFKQRLIL